MFTWTQYLHAIVLLSIGGLGLAITREFWPLLALLSVCAALMVAARKLLRR